MNNFLKKHKNDFILIAAILILALTALIVLLLNLKSGNTVKVLIDGEEKYSFSLKEDIEKVISQGEKQNILVIKGGRAYISDATCPDKICVSHRPIEKVDETIVCIPQRVVIEIAYE